MKQSKNNVRISRRQLIQGAGAIGLGAVGASANARITRAQGAPAIVRGTTLTVSTWGGVTQDGIKAYAQKEFEKQTGATLAFDIGGQGARYNKLLAQRANPPADVFFSTDEAVRAPTSFRTDDLLYIYGGDEWGHELYDLRADAAVSEREARLAGQVLRVVMRDLDPGR